MKSKRYTVFPQGMSTRKELEEAIELLNLSLKEPKVVKHNGFWNVEAGRKEEIKGRGEMVTNTSDIELVKRTIKEITGKPTEVIYSKMIALYSTGYADGFNSATKKLAIVMGTTTDSKEFEEGCETNDRKP